MGIDRAKEESERLAHIELVKNFEPVINSISEFNKMKIYMENKSYGIWNTARLKNSASTLDSICLFADTCLSFTAKFVKEVNIPKYYLYDRERKMIEEKQDSLLGLILDVKLLKFWGYLDKEGISPDLHQSIFAKHFVKYHHGTIVEEKIRLKKHIKR